MENKTISRHLSNFNIAGFTYWDGCITLCELKVGTLLKLVREEENKFDPNAVAIYYKEYKLGFVPRDENELISKMLDLGYADAFELRVQRVSPESHPEKQISVVLFLKAANEVFIDK